MKNLFSLSLIALLLSSAAVFAKPGWIEDYEKGLEKAKAENKLVLLDFTGSDWCGWCIRLDEEVFSQQQFKNYARKNLVLVELDFPQKKPQADALKAQNEKLQQQYKIEGYPTIIVLNSNGKPVGTLGYMEGGPKAFIAELDKLKKGAGLATSDSLKAPATSATDLAENSGR